MNNCFNSLLLLLALSSISLCAGDAGDWSDEESCTSSSSVTPDIDDLCFSLDECTLEQAHAAAGRTISGRVGEVPLSSKPALKLGKKRRATESRMEDNQYKREKGR